MNLKALAALAALPLLAAAPMIGCENSSNRRAMYTTNNADLTLDASSGRVLAGETVTIIARTVDTYGRDAKIEWNSTAGDLKTEQDGRVARVQFKEVGTYTVRAQLMVDGQVVASDLVEVRVQPVS